MGSGAQCGPAQHRAAIFSVHVGRHRKDIRPRSKKSPPRVMRRSPWPKVGAAAALLAVVAGWSVLRAGHPTDGPAPAPAAAPALPPPPTPAPARDEAKYAGSAACGECHQDEYAGW